jgi:glycosyltransferase involved in cell wall biosynthesis
MSEENKKIKILTISDHPLSPSGVGTQTRYILEHLIKTGKYSVVSLGGAVRHENYSPIKTEQHGDDWIIYPVDGYGDQNKVRSMIMAHKPDMLWFMTDPRFYGFLWDMEDEIRSKIPMIYYHVWDNLPYPTFNKAFYDSTDVICTISKVTDDIVKNVSPDVERHYIPHIVNPEIFKKLAKEEVDAFRKNSPFKDKFLIFWNSRNARRKMSGSLIFWYKEFLDKVGHDNACLFMHTDPKDVHGQDLEAILVELGLHKGQVMFSTQKSSAQELNLFYNAADITCGISDAEGFGLSTFESLAAGTPILVNMTGGLQEQVTNGEEWFGKGIEPSSKAIIGSQQVPFIYEDRISKEAFLEALHSLYEATPEEREAMGKAGQDHIDKNYNYNKILKSWDNLLTETHEKYGSWDTRKLYKKWELTEL